MSPKLEENPHYRSGTVGLLRIYKDTVQPGVFLDVESITFPTISLLCKTLQDTEFTE